ncbi:hypothetical protein [Bacillus piscicola]|uniref:hypothetical protein n=1 Tax=Bacillus piscicola TaxID=1632684 RepID=UPI001F09FC96|nr:hypothetical protein [Bacillus piscicola]
MNATHLCDRCDGRDNVKQIHINDELKVYCQHCYTELFSKKKPVGRPPVGTTKKISLTLPEHEWEWFEKEAQGNRSQFLRHLVWEAQSTENKWSNQACLGYAIVGAQKLGYEEKQIKELIQAIYGVFDVKSITEAEDMYRDSPY